MYSVQSHGISVFQTLHQPQPTRQCQINGRRKKPAPFFVCIKYITCSMQFHALNQLLLIECMNSAQWTEMTDTSMISQTHTKTLCRFCKKREEKTVTNPLDVSFSSIRPDL